MSRLSHKFGLCLLFLILGLYFPKISKADTVIFEDNFNDGDASGWIVPRNTCSSSWQVNNLSYGITINSGCITETIPSSLAIPSNLDYSFEVDMSMPGSANMDRNFVFKYLNSSNWYGIHTLGQNLYLHKVVNGNESFLTNWHTSYPFTDNGTYHFKIIVRSSGYEIYINDVLHTIVPESGATFVSTQAGLQASAGGIPNSQVSFDNVRIALDPSIPTPPTPSPTPDPTLPPTPSPSPSPTPIPTIGPFDLPIQYPGRPATNPSEFKSAFWSNLNAAFDHLLQTGYFNPFTGSLYFPADCPSGVVGIKCYDSHNGTDFSRNNSTDIFSVGTGTVYYASPHTYSTCTPEKSFGCVVIVGYPGNVFGLYAHLSKINVLVGQPVDQNTNLGIMGETGCPGCGVHLHLGILKPVGNFMLAQPFMTKKDWQGLLSNMKGDGTKSYRPSCTYSAPNRIQFSFQDPSGWKGAGIDPWSLSKSQGGCGINSPYLWKFDIGSTP